MKGRRIATALIATLALTVGVTPALAQKAGASQAEVRQTVARYATCLFNVSGYKVRKILELPFGDTASITGLSGLMSLNCAGKVGGEVQMRFPPLVMRGLLYEEIYARDFRDKTAIPSFEGTPSPVYPFAVEQTAKRYVVAYRVAMTFGECVARLVAPEARVLVLSPVASPAEAEAIRAITPALSSCVDAGQTMELSRSIVRGAIAEALYRLTLQRQAGGAK